VNKNKQYVGITAIMSIAILTLGCWLRDGFIITAGAALLVWAGIGSIIVTFSRED
jgi:hypothetical protein